MNTSPRYCFLALLFTLGLAGCASTPAAAPPKATDPLQNFADTQSVEVLYATNREAGSGHGGTCDDGLFGIAPGKDMHFGSCRINVPKRHRVGQIEVAPTPRSDPHQYFRSLSHTPLASMDALVAQLKQHHPAGGALVFVHGFNVRFEEAVMRAAQIAYDLKFQGPVVLFTWPAGAGQGFLDGTLITRTYEANKAAAEATIPLAADFFRQLASLDFPVHVMVHSMGHQVVVPALAAVATPQPGQPAVKPFIGELILNAPDIPVDDFTRLAPAARTLTRRTTVYCSFNDNAISASETYNKNRRMGACEAVDGVDVINVSEIDAPTLGIGGLGHGYYASRPILTDVSQLLMGLPAEQRIYVRKSEPNSVENFYLRP